MVQYCPLPGLSINCDFFETILSDNVLTTAQVSSWRSLTVKNVFAYNQSYVSNFQCFQYSQKSAAYRGGSKSPYSSAN